ncbi:MAG: TlpA family protein disulfide reductase [Saprospiraceae bacterium]|nr:TlpA family protein disulfide reductase [Saprospiraceae bacterium]
MKKITLLLLCTSLFSFGQNELSYVLYSGNIKNTNELIIKIINHDNSFIKEVTIDKSGNFMDTLFIAMPGTYFFQIGRSYSTMFLRKGYNLNVSIDSDDFYKSIHYKGKGSEVNNFQVAKGILKNELVGDAKEFFVVPIDDFLRKIKKNKEAFLALLEESGLTGNDKEIQRKLIEYDYLLTRYNYDKFVHYHTKKHPELPSDYYSPILQMDIDDEESFINDKSYRSLIIENWRLTSTEALKKDPNISLIELAANAIKDIKSEKIKDQIVSMLFRQISLNNENYENDYTKILALLSDDKMKEKLTSRYNSINTTKPEMVSADFNYENHKGGKTSLRDLKGKLLYIEVWATWCGPCKKEIPALKALIEEYRGKNIEFVSISVDSKKDYDKWRTMVAEENVGGVQLFADNSFDSEFIKFYGIGMIPRSIMLDVNGKIITQKAPRPSSDETRSFIDNLLNKKVEMMK